ncbi:MULTISPECIES: GntR family transcriptional regulator [Marinomonas]|uniref:GntR family transcriptional regulator n=2 Tax=Marinomonas TaxID=28253 RepID=A0A366CX10_9GAMM|nr:MULTISPECIES: GntR family transcriptional regulator [Marinomonas]AEF54146.1 transcriptional regulator, GntR family with UTRA sensor domain [Marinomonas posidonica IVIA-Po-181]RBO82371.1 GntR family transcriptional regulator [Marinomonas aquiplantarum]
MTIHRVNDLFGPSDALKKKGIPLYIQVKNAIQTAIAEERLGNGDVLPPERDLAKYLDVSRVTIRKAIDELVKEDVLTQRQGAGTFVSERVEQPLNHLRSFTEVMRDRGKETTAKWLDRSLGVPHDDERHALQLSPEEEVVRFYRLRYVDGKPMALELATVPSHYLDNPFAIEGSLYEILEAQGRRPVRAFQRIRAITLDDNRAQLLDISEQAAVLYIERTGVDKEGTPVEFTRSWFPGDSYDFVAEIHDTH